MAGPALLLEEQSRQAGTRRRKGRPAGAAAEDPVGTGPGEGMRMPYEPLRHRRRTIRLKGYDYTRAGAYFVTVCVQGRERLFGEIVDGEMRLNEAGRMVQSVWDESPVHYPGVEVDAFVVMPNHVHGIVVLTGDVGVGAGPDDTGQPRGSTSGRSRPCV